MQYELFPNLRIPRIPRTIGLIFNSFEQVSSTITPSKNVTEEKMAHRGGDI